MPEFRGITYHELVKQGSPEEDWETDTLRVTRKVLVEWGEHVAFIAEVVGYPELVGGPTDAYVSRITPMPYQPSEGDDKVYAVSVNAVGYGTPDPDDDQEDPDTPFPVRTMLDDLGNASFGNALCTIHYQRLTYDILEDSEVSGVDGEGHPTVGDETTLKRYVTCLFKPTVEYLSLPLGCMFWKGALPPEPVPTGIPKRESKGQLQVTWHQVPLIPGAITDQIGTVNNAIFVASQIDRSFNPGTLLALAPEIRPYYSALGKRIWDITYIFSYFEPEPGIGHNYLLRQQGIGIPPVYTEVTSTGTDSGTRIYKATDFTEFFRPIP